MVVMRRRFSGRSVGRHLLVLVGRKRKKEAAGVEKEEHGSLGQQKHVTGRSRSEGDDDMRHIMALDTIYQFICKNVAPANPARHAKSCSNPGTSNKATTHETTTHP